MTTFSWEWFLAGFATPFLVLAIVAAIYEVWLGPWLDKYDRGHK